MTELKIKKGVYIFSIFFVLSLIAILVVCLYLPDSSFSSGSAEEAHVSKIVVIGIIAFVTFIFIIIMPLTYNRQKKDIASLYAFRDQIDKDALFFEGQFVIAGQRQEDAKKTAKSVLLSLPLTFLTGIGIYKFHSHNPYRIFIVSSNMVYAIDTQTLQGVHFGKESVQSAEIIETDINHVKLVLDHGQYTAMFSTKNTMISNSELAQRLKNIFLEQKI